MSTLKPMLLGNLKRAILGFGIRKLPLIAGHKLFTNVISDVGCAHFGGGKMRSCYLKKKC